MGLMVLETCAGIRDGMRHTTQQQRDHQHERGKSRGREELGGVAVDARADRTLATPASKLTARRMRSPVQSLVCLKRSDAPVSANALETGGLLLAYAVQFAALAPSVGMHGRRNGAPKSLLIAVPPFGSGFVPPRVPQSCKSGTRKVSPFCFWRHLRTRFLTRWRHVAGAVCVSSVRGVLMA